MNQNSPPKRINDEPVGHSNEYAALEVKDEKSDMIDVHKKHQELQDFWISVKASRDVVDIENPRVTTKTIQTHGTFNA